MKFLISGLTAVFLIAGSCEKDKPLSEEIIGKWEVEYIIEYAYVNDTLVSEYKEYIADGLVSLQLVEGGNGIFTDPSDSYIFNWTLNGNTLILNNVTQWQVHMEGDYLVWSFTLTDPEDNKRKYKESFTARKIL